MSIQILPDYVVAQIAAGEVIERPASAMKELIENALDAGASNIHVATTGGGRQLIRISDDGGGIPADEVDLAFARHATSKLRQVDDLSTIQTLGFRGEALASIAAVSRISATTRHKSDSNGTMLKIEAGRFTQKKSVGAPVGTVISVENLFYNMPARLKFLKSDNAEKRQIVNVMTRYAMAYPHVRFVLEQDGREIFRSNGSGQLADVLAKSLGLDQFKNMVEVNSEADAYAEPSTIRVFGYTSEPSLNRADRSHIVLFVNGRWIQDSKLSYAIIQAYHTFLMNGRYPVSVLMIELPPEDVDVNVHPTKAEIRFRDPHTVFEVVQRAVRRAVIDFARTPVMRNGRYSAAGPEVEALAEYMEQLDMELRVSSPGQSARRYPSEDWSDNEAASQNPSGFSQQTDTPGRPRTLPLLRVIGQVSAAYIVAEGPVGLYLIDQHAAHERILYEQFMLAYARQEPVAQFTLSAQTINLPPLEARLVEENMDALQMAGFKLEVFGPNTFIIRSVPAMLSDDNPVEAVRGILDDLEQGITPGHVTIEEKIIKQVCKRAAVKAGQVLSHKEMEGIIRQLERCQSPLTCPHGRPTMIHMTSDQLAREFGRK
jgi:DNA mismatch repair protein MutL